MPPRSRSYVDGKIKLPAKIFKPYLEHTNRPLSLEHQLKLPKNFTIESHDHYDAIAWFNIDDDQRFPVPLNWDNTRYPRLIFICPCCVKKRLNLYGAKNGWACRECLGLHYRCQSEAPLERLTRATIKQRKQIWGDKAEQDLLSYSCPIKPKGRHSIKFARDYQRLDKVEVQRFELLRTYLKSIKSNLDYGLGIMV
ncbi:hypothetical protein [Shewanella sp.]|uniref:hypothetical protein n=1 Tax=Shewanella sp. TaxID=50422 RepID=UPI0040481486